MLKIILNMMHECRFDSKGSFAKQAVGAEPVKTAQSTIKILELQSSPRI